MSEKPKEPKIPLGMRLKYYLDRLRMPRLNAELANADRLICLMRKTITDLTIEWKWCSSFRDDRAMGPLDMFGGKDLEEIAAEGRQRIKWQKEEIEGWVEVLENFMSMRDRILRALETKQDEKTRRQIETSSRSLEQILDDILRHVEGEGGGNDSQKDGKFESGKGSNLGSVRKQKKEYLN